MLQLGSRDSAMQTKFWVDCTWQCPLKARGFSFTSCSYTDVGLDALGLLASDDECSRCLSEAAQTSSPARLRLLFVHILANCEVRDPQSLCASFAADLAEDLAEASPLRDILLLALLERELQRLDKSLIHCGWTALSNTAGRPPLAPRWGSGLPSCGRTAESLLHA